VLAKLQVLSNETRFEIVKLVRSREMAAGTIARRFKLTRPAISLHIGVLGEDGLLDERRVGSQHSMSSERKGSTSLRRSSRDFCVLRLRQLKQAAEAAEQVKK